MQETFEIRTSHHQEMVTITRHVQQAVADCSLLEGVAHVFTQHTTCGLTINENADPDVAHDLLQRLEELVPWEHNGDRHGEGNSAAHLRSLITGCSLTIPVRSGRLQLGTWQGIFLCEFDGPRTRKVLVDIIHGL